MNANHGRLRGGALTDLARRGGGAVLLGAPGRQVGLAVDLRGPATGAAIEYRAKASTRCRHALAAWNWRTRRWVTVGSRRARTVLLRPRLAPAAHVKAGRIRLRATCLARNGPVRLSIDVLRAQPG